MYIGFEQDLDLIFHRLITEVAITPLPHLVSVVNPLDVHTPTMSANLCFAEQPSNANLKDPACKTNRENWGQVLEQFEINLEAVSAEGDEASLARHQQRGQLLRKLPPETLDLRTVTPLR